MSAESSLDPFSTEILLTIPSLTDDDPTIWHGFQFDGSLDSTVFHLPDVNGKGLPQIASGAFKLNLEHVAPPPCESSSSSSSVSLSDDSSCESDDVVGDKPEILEDDIWRLPEVTDRRKNFQLHSWDQFKSPGFLEPQTSYITEAGAATFDAVLQQSSISKVPATILVAGEFLHALFEMSLGRSSTSFHWNEEQLQFIPRTASFTISGCSPNALKAVVESIAWTGSQLRKLKDRCNACLSGTGYANRGNIAFHAAVAGCLTAIQEHLEGQRSECISMLRIQHYHERSMALLSMLDDLGNIAGQEGGDRSLLSALNQGARDVVMVYPEFEPVLQTIISSTAVPVLQDLDVEVGLSARFSTSAVDLTPRNDVNKKASWECLFPPETSELILETSCALRLLRENGPEKIPQLYETTREERELRFEHTWESISDLHAHATEYERKVKSVILGTRRTNGPANNSSADSTNRSRNSSSLHDFYVVDLDFDAMQTELAQITNQGTIQNIALGCLKRSKPCAETLYLAHDQALDLSVLPMLSAQQRLVSYSVFELLFKDHSLLTHLRLQRRFQLFGDGLFASQLSTALFDSDQSSGEGQRRTGAATGLRLQTRDTWPPASSELRLVLMGILADSLHKSDADAFQDSMSFAIRDLSDDELDQCRNADSIHALDFLRLQYRPTNSVLEAVIDSNSLEKYDRIFQYLLRILRVQGVTQSLLRDVSFRRRIYCTTVDHRFRVELHHFISTLAAYSQNIAIGVGWSQFENTFTEIASKLDKQDYDGTLKCGKTLSHLREMHLSALDSILRALLLKRKQTAAKRAIEEIFGIVLQLASHLRHAQSMHSNTNHNDDNGTMTRRFYEEFKAQVRALLKALQTAAVETDNSDEMNVYEHLLISLDMFGYWTRTSGA